MFSRLGRPSAHTDSRQKQSKYNLSPKLGRLPPPTQYCRLSWTRVCAATLPSAGKGGASHNGVLACGSKGDSICHTRNLTTQKNLGMQASPPRWHRHHWEHTARLALRMQASRNPRARKAIQQLLALNCSAWLVAHAVYHTTKRNINLVGIASKVLTLFRDLALSSRHNR